MAIRIIMFCLYPQSALNKMTASDIINRINNIRVPTTEEIPLRQFSAFKSSEDEIVILYRVHQKVTIPSIEGAQELLVERIFYSKILISEGLLLCYTSSRKKALEMASFIKDELLGEAGELVRVEYPDKFLRKLRDDFSLYTTFLRVKAEDPLNQIVLIGKDVTNSQVYKHFRLHRNDILEIEVKPEGIPVEGVFLRFARKGKLMIKGINEMQSKKYEEIERRVIALIQKIHGKICPETKLTEFG